MTYFCKSQTLKLSFVDDEEEEGEEMAESKLESFSDPGIKVRPSHV